MDFGFYTLQDGWIVAGESGDELDVTHDGGKTWEEVSLPAPDSCENCVPAYGLDTPIFQDHQNGTLTVAFWGDADPNYTYVYRTYDTHDVGDSWQDKGVQAQPLKGEVVSSVGGHEIRVSPTMKQNRSKYAMAQGRSALPFLQVLHRKALLGKSRLSTI